MSRKHSFIADQRGAASIEMIFVYPILALGLLFPLFDVGNAGFRYIAAHQALRDMGQRTQYSLPGDVTDSSSYTAWKNSLPGTVDGYAITAKVYCDGTEAPCSSSSTIPKYYTFSTSFTLSPVVLGQMLCSTCQVSYSQRFQ